MNPPDCESGDLVVMNTDQTIECKVFQNFGDLRLRQIKKQYSNNVFNTTLHVSIFYEELLDELNIDLIERQLESISIHPGNITLLQS